ncbi:MAG: CBS domain-containing protein [Betaproteobacteria bacterium]|nr:CBS domain-containing protein [Betaproteobacteria bacterium]
MPGSSTEADRSPRPPSFSPYASLRRLAHHAPLVVAPSASVREVLRALDERRADAAVVVDAGTRLPLGIVTLRDVLRRIAIDGGDPDTPVAAAMTGGLITLPADSTAHQASVVMVRRSVGHLVLTEADGSFCNTISQADLYALPGAAGSDLVPALLAARDVAALANVAKEIRAFANALLAERVGPEAIVQRISALNDLLALQVIELTAGRFDLPYVPWCWLVFGSEGRLEQTLATDQDNGLVFAAASPEEAASLRARFLPFARAVNEALDACGFTLCKGNIMAGNPACCLSLAEWKSAFSGWLAEAQPEAVLNSTIFFDFRPLYGQDALAVELRDWLLVSAPTHAIFLRALVDSTLGWDSPLNWWNGFRYDNNRDHAHSIDLKKHGARPFVDAARIYALAHGVPDTHTVERLRGAAARIGMPGHELAALIDAYHHIQRLRLEHQAANPAADPNRIDPDRLHALDRHILKESLKQARKLQQRLERDYVAV